MSTPPADFDVAALFAALDHRRAERALTWAAAVREINAPFGVVPGVREISASTVTGLRRRSAVEGDGVLQMLLWLDRSPESFVPGHPAPDRGTALRKVGPSRILRWDTAALHRALEAERAARALTWKQVADEIGTSVATVTGLRTASRVTFPGVMRIVAWLGRPAATFTHATRW